MCIDITAFSDMLSALSCGKYTFISDGASVPGVSWNSNCTPAMSWLSSGWTIRSVGAIRLMVPPIGAPLPIPVSTWPRSVLGTAPPLWYMPRRNIAVPASTFSWIACSMKPSGA
ncbi:hypothetical protein D3C81_1566430 [compost metagenome]